MSSLSEKRCILFFLHWLSLLRRLLLLHGLLLLHWLKHLHDLLLHWLKHLHDLLLHGHILDLLHGTLVFAALQPRVALLHRRPDFVGLALLVELVAEIHVLVVLRHQLVQCLVACVLLLRDLVGLRVPRHPAPHLCDIDVVLVTMALEHLRTNLGLLHRVKNTANLEAAHGRPEVVLLVEDFLEVLTVFGLEEAELVLQIRLLEEVTVRLAQRVNHRHLLGVRRLQVLEQRVEMPR